MPRILSLPADAISQIHSAKQITTLHDVVLALFENSLDANATHVHVSVDFRRGACSVGDDGDGIASSEFAEDGGLGKMHSTSKRASDWTPTHDLHGSNGTYLASIASLSLLNVTSSQAGTTGQSSLTVHQGRVLQRQANIPTSELNIATRRGTQVTIRDLFGNLPVRVKQRAREHDSATDEDKAWHQLKRGIAALLLAWSSPCSVRMSDDNVPDRKVKMAGLHSSTSSAVTMSGLRQLDAGLKQTFGVTEALPIVFQAGLATHDTRSRWVPVSTSAVDLTIKGLICLDPAPDRQCQFVSLGIRPCGYTSGCSDVYDMINKVFTNSSFGACDDFSDIERGGKGRQRGSPRYRDGDYVKRQLHSRKGVDRWPMFVLQANFRETQTTKNSADELSDAALKRIVSVLEATVTQWLTAHHFRPRKKSSRRRNLDQQRPTSALSRIESSSKELTLAGKALRRPTPHDLQHSGSASGPTRAEQKVMDLSARPATTNLSLQPAHAVESPFSAWSRIKSSRQGYRQSRPPGAVTSPCRPLESSIAATSSVRTTAFTLPAIEAGELSAARQQHAILHSPADTRDIPVKAGGTQICLSESYGSFDDEEMVSAATEAESRFQTLAHNSDLHTGSTNTAFDCTDPRTKQQYRVHARTGTVLPPQYIADDNGVSGTVRQSAAINTTSASRGEPLSLARLGKPVSPATDCTATTTDAWLPGFLRDWSNPIFVHQDGEHIPAAPSEGSGLEAEDACRHANRFDALLGGFHGGCVGNTARLKKAPLASARVIGQVDCKFILCALPMGHDGSHDGETIVLIDQHAASERILLEELLAELCEPADATSPVRVKTLALGKAIHFQLSQQEHGLFQAHSSYFSNWGIVYNLSPRSICPPASQQVREGCKEEHFLTVTHLPPGIAERCALVPRLLIELLRAEVWAMANAAKRSASVARSVCASDAEHSWLQRIGSCPKGVLDMLNSRACRSAIMFNDELSSAECEDLVFKLSACAFPFMCAHGRVSMVPLIDLGGHDVADGLASFAGNIGESTEKYRAAFERWTSGQRSMAIGTNRDS